MLSVGCYKIFPTLWLVGFKCGVYKLLVVGGLEPLFGRLFQIRGYVLKEATLARSHDLLGPEPFWNASQITSEENGRDCRHPTYIRIYIYIYMWYPPESSTSFGVNSADPSLVYQFKRLPVCVYVYTLNHRTCAVLKQYRRC